MTPEQFIIYVARVSNPENQNNPNYTKLMQYLIDHEHWSPFEHVSVTFEVITSRAIAAQILRHKSFAFQEYSLRYSTAQSIHDMELRTPAEKNRQSSEKPYTKWYILLLSMLYMKCALWFYQLLLYAGVSKETARFYLPLGTETRLYITGTVRSYIHYIKLRTKPDTQKEHRMIAVAMQAEMKKHFPSLVL